MYSLYVYLYLSDTPEKCDDIREVAWSPGECVDHPLGPAPWEAQIGEKSKYLIY